MTDFTARPPAKGDAGRARLEAYFRKVYALLAPDGLFLNHGITRPSVTFFDGFAVIGTSVLSGGFASVTTTTLSLGSHSIKAVYGGDANVNAVTSAVLTQTVKHK
jgi:Bacterial Ig-like domain (group 3)